MVSQAKMDRVRIALGSTGGFSVDSRGNGGGLALLWHDKDLTHLLRFSPNHIDVLVHLPGMDE